MSRPSTTYIVETAEELKQLMQAQKKPKIKERLQALYLLKVAMQPPCKTWLIASAVVKQRLRIG